MIGTYKNILKAKNGVYRNDDSVMPSYWISRDGDDLRLVTDIGELRNEKLSRNIYFSATNFPHTNRYNCFKPSVFEDWLILTSNYVCEVKDDVITINSLPKVISYQDYQGRVYDNIVRNIHKIYETRPYGALFYSGGIDSMAILSFIKSLGYLPRTRVVFSKNMTQSQAAYLKPDRMGKILEMRDIIKDECLSFDMVETATNDIVDLFNRFGGDHFRMLTYCSSHCETKYSDLVLIEGEGDTVHLHTKQILHGIVTVNDSYSRFESLKTQPLYSADALSYVPGGEFNSFENVVLRTKMYRGISRINNNSFAQPIVDGGFDLIRQLDFYGVEVIDSLNATLPRDFIHRNVGTLFDNCILTEFSLDFDIINSVMLPIKDLNLEHFTVPAELVHNIEGLTFLNEEINRFAKDRDGLVNLNTLISIGTLRYLNKLLEKHYA